MMESLKQGPLYFFDQPKIKKERDRLIGLRERLANLNSSSSYSHKTGCTHRKSGCAEHMEKYDTLMENNSAKKDPQTYDSSVFRTIHQDPLAQPSLKFLDPLSEEVSPLTSLEEYKGMALTMLCELEETLKHFSKYKFVLPQGILNILPCSWEELTDDACCVEKTGLEPVYKNIKSGRGQTSEEHIKLSPASEYIDCEMAEGIKRQHRTKAEIPTDTTKGAKNRQTLLNRLNGNKTIISEQNTSDLPVAISFSLSSIPPEERGGVFQHSGQSIQALERLHLAKIQMTEQLPKEGRVDKPVIFHHYADERKEGVLKNIKGCKKIFSEVLNEKLKLPRIKKPGPTFKKLHYELADGSSFIYYPSGHFAVCQTSSNLPNGGMYTNIFNDAPDQALLGTFTPFGHGSVCFPNSNNIAMIFNQEGGLMTNKDGEIFREWKWPGVGKLDNPVIVQVNKCITVKIAGRFAISLVYRWQHETVQLSLSPVRSVVVPQVTKTPRIPKDGQSHIRDVGATQELRKLKRKVRNILENWLEYYWIALGLGSPPIHKTYPMQSGRLRKVLPGAVSPDLQTRQRKMCRRNEVSAFDYLSHFQSVPARSLRQHASLGSSSSSKKSWYPTCTSCPAALRRAMLGGDGKLCKCSNHQIPYITDLEYNNIINNPVSSPEQITVICITSSVRSADYDPSPDEHLESLYKRKEKNRSMPCIQSHLDSYRLLKYDINSAEKFTHNCGSLLVKRHHVVPGMFLMYIQGKLLFANHIFNGHSKSTKDLQKQMAVTRCNYNRGYYLPIDYKFRYCAL